MGVVVQPVPLPPEPPTPIIEVVIEVPKAHASTTDEKINYYADKYHLSGWDKEEMFKTLDCESAFDPSAKSGMYYKNGKSEESYGIAQIHLPDHINISKEQALDIDFSLDFMAHEFSKGNKRIWSCWQIIYGHKSGII